MASMHVLEQSPTSVDLDTDSVQNVRYSRPRLGCGAIVGGFTIVSTLLFALFAYPHYQ